MKKYTVILLVGLFLPRLLAGGEVLSAPASVKLYDRQGRVLRSFLSDRETYSHPVLLSDMSPWLPLSAVAAEDRRFYTHPGIDWRALLRAGWQNIRRGGIVSGASTITQQLVRARTPRAKTLRGKVSEMLDALYLERHHNKEEILQAYLNILEFGHLTQGVSAAAQYYFGVNVSELSLAQSALLAGLAQSPIRLDPLKNPRGAMLRRSRVLYTMRKGGFITQEQYDRAMQEPLGISAIARPFDAPHFARRVYELVPEASEIHTTLDGDLQEYAERAIGNHLAKLTEHNVTNAAVLVLDNVSGEVLAYIGSADFYDTLHSGQIDGVSALRQPGSALKPFVYALALQHGLTAASILQDEDTFFEGGFRPRNYDESFHGGVSVRRALACSYNVPAVKAAEPLGAARLLSLLHVLGFESLKKPPEFYGLGLALGSGEVTLLELATAYSALARGGNVRPAVFATVPYLAANTRQTRALDAQTAYIITDILSDNTARADAFGLNSSLYFPFAAAAKTGTSKDYRDNFAIGYTARLTVAVWAGNFDASSMQKVSGISGAAPIMHDVLAYAHTKYPSGPFARPQGIITAQVCENTGRLADAACPHTREEIFAQGHLPATEEEAVAPLQILFPQAGDVFVYDPALPADAQRLHLQSNGRADCRWSINGQEMPEEWWNLRRGKYTATAQCGTEQAQVRFEVL